MTLGHLETKLHSTKLLESPVEYKQALLLYAKKIADEGFRAKGEELIKELFGPVYWYVAGFVLSLVCTYVWIGDQGEMTGGVRLLSAYQSVIC